MSRSAALLALLVVLATAAVPTPVSAGQAEGEDAPPTWYREYQEGSIHDAVAVPGGYVLVGRHRRYVGGEGVDRDVDEAWAAKVDHTGDVVWARTFNGTDIGVLYGVDRSADGGVIAVGKREASSVPDQGRLWAVRLDAEGSVEWEATYGRGELFDVAAKPDGGAVAVGQSWMPWPEGFAVGVDGDGNERWNQSFGGRDLRAVVPERVGSGYLLAGKAEREHGRVEGARAIALTEGGDVRWAKFFGNDTPGATVIRPRPDGYVVAGGRTVIRVDFLRKPKNITRLDAVEGGILALRETPDGATVVGLGSSRGSSGLARFDPAWRLKRLDQSVGHVQALVPVGDGRFLAVGMTEPVFGSGFAYLTDQVPPTAALSATPTVAETGVTEVTLDASSSTDNTEIQYYQWDLDGNGSVDAQSPEPNVTHVYDRLGPVNTTVTAIDVDGNRANASVEVVLEDTTPPEAELSAPSPRFVATTAPARLNASASTDNHRIVEYRWDFEGDGTVDTVTDGPAVRHKFSGGPLHWVELTVVDSVGHSTTRSFSIEVGPNDGPPNLTVRSGLAVVGDRTYFEANATDRVGTPTVTWIFPDGNRTTGTVATHVFDRSGEQNVTVVVADEYGAERRTNVTVDVRDSYPSDVVGPGFAFIPILFILLALLGLILVPAFGVSIMAIASELRDGDD